MFRIVLVAAIATLAAFSPVPVTHADPDDPDPHIPNMAVNYCPNGGPKWLWATTYCDGMPYADGSYWHIVKFEATTGSDGYTSPARTSPMECVVNPGAAPVPQAAPPGGCDGAVP